MSWWGSESSVGSSLRHGRAGIRKTRETALWKRLFAVAGSPAGGLGGPPPCWALGSASPASCTALMAVASVGVIPLCASDRLCTFFIYRLSICKI